MVKKGSAPKARPQTGAGAVSGGKKRPAKGNKQSSGMKRLFSGIVLLLALWGAHNLLIDHVPGYAPMVRNAVGSVVNKTRDTASDTGKKLASQPTITIKNAEDLTKSDYDNLSLGVPGWNCDVILDRAGYALGYKEDWEQPLWVSYHLTKPEVLSKRAKRSDNFRPDDAIPTGSATLEDYKGSLYDRGHLAPAADMSFSVQAMSESFFLSNMSPQRAELNRGAWKDLEELVRDAAIACDDVYVVTGPVFYPDKKVITIGANEVAVPHAYYKVLLDKSGKSSKAIGFILPNAECRKPLSEYAVTVDAVERATGLDFFNQLDDSVELKVESECDYERWVPEK